MKKMLYILNPVAGTRRGAKELADVLAVFNRAGWQVEVFITEALLSAVSVAEARGGEFDMVVCCGGDGTLNEVLSGLIRGGHETPIGYIPAGSTNDFASSLSLPQSCVESAKKIVAGSVHEYDAGQFGSRNFCYCACFGAFTRASYSTPQSMKNLLGHTAYILGGMQELSQLHDEYLRFTIDGETVEGDYIFGAICNSTSVGGLLQLSSDQVDLSDGRFEVLLIRMPQDLTELSEALLDLSQKRYNSGILSLRSASELIISAPADMPWTVDGEKEEGHSSITVRNLSRRLKLVH